MYTKSVPFKDYNGKPRNLPVHFNLETRDVFKVVGELNRIFKWRDGLKGPERELTDEEMTDFFNDFEAVLLAAWGEPSEDGLYFVRTNRYLFEDSKLFAACMDMFVTDIGEVTRMLNEIMPKGMEEVVKKQAESLEKMQSELPSETDPKTRAAIQAQIEVLNKQLAEGA